MLRIVQAKGYAGSCMNDVAQRAGVSTKTVYRLIPNKADLLRRVISDTIGMFMLNIDAQPMGLRSIFTTLARAARDGGNI